MYTIECDSYDQRWYINYEDWTDGPFETEQSAREVAIEQELDEYHYQEMRAGEVIYQEFPSYIEEESETSMSVKVEVEKEDTSDKIIKKQSEVWVWNDKVFASYAAALAAKNCEQLIAKFVEAMYPTATKQQKTSYINTWTAHPNQYYLYVDKALKVFNDLLAEAIKENTAA